MQGKVTLQKLSRRFWADDAVFEDNMNKAVGMDEVDAQWVSSSSVRGWEGVLMKDSGDSRLYEGYQDAGP